MNTNLNDQLLANTEVSPYTKFFRPQVGQNAIRLFAVDETATILFKEHFLKWSYICRKPERCPVCEIADRFNLPQCKAVDKFLIYIYDLKDPENPIKLWNFGKKLAQQINAIVKQGFDLMSLKTGIALSLTRTGQGRQTTYALTPSQKAFDLTNLVDISSLTPLKTFLEDRRKDDTSHLLESIQELPEVDYNTKQNIITYLVEQGFIDKMAITVKPQTAEVQSSEDISFAPGQEDTSKSKLSDLDDILKSIQG